MTSLPESPAHYVLHQAERSAREQSHLLYAAHAPTLQGQAHVELQGGYNVIVCYDPQHSYSYLFAAAPDGLTSELATWHNRDLVIACIEQHGLLLEPEVPQREPLTWVIAPTNRRQHAQRIRRIDERRDNPKVRTTR